MCPYLDLPQSQKHGSNTQMKIIMNFIELQLKEFPIKLIVNFSDISDPTECCPSPPPRVKIKKEKKSLIILFLNHLWYFTYNIFFLFKYEQTVTSRKKKIFNFSNFPLFLVSTIM